MRQEVDWVAQIHFQSSRSVLAHQRSDETSSCAASLSVLSIITRMSVTRREVNWVVQVCCQSLRSLLAYQHSDERLLALLHSDFYPHICTQWDVEFWRFVFSYCELIDLYIKVQHQNEEDYKSNPPAQYQISSRTRSHCFRFLDYFSSPAQHKNPRRTLLYCCRFLQADYQCSHSCANKLCIHQQNTKIPEEHICTAADSFRPIVSALIPVQTSRVSF